MTGGRGGAEESPKRAQELSPGVHAEGRQVHARPQLPGIRRGRAEAAAILGCVCAGPHQGPQGEDYIFKTMYIYQLICFSSTRGSGCRPSQNKGTA